MDFGESRDHHASNADGRQRRQQTQDQSNATAEFRHGGRGLEGAWYLHLLGHPTSRILTLSFEEVPAVFPNQPSGFSFIGGFDAPETAFDHDKDTSFLVLLSPAAEAAKQFGSVDL